MIPFCIAVSLFTLPVFAAGGGSLTAGTARVDITPPLDMKASLGGYGERMSRPATGVHDRIWVKALLLRQGEKRFVLVTADMLALPPGFKSAVLERLNKGRRDRSKNQADEWRDDQVMLLASHSHTSIDMTALNPKNDFGIPQMGIYQPALFERTRVSSSRRLSMKAEKGGAYCRGLAPRALCCRAGTITGGAITREFSVSLRLLASMRMRALWPCS